MKYTEKTFTLPTSNGKITQDKWEKAVGAPQKGTKQVPARPIEKRG